MHRRRDVRRSGIRGAAAPGDRPVGVLAAAALVVANMVGTGIFVTSGYLAHALGNAWLLVAMWLVGGVLSLCGATVYAELGAMMPRAGGEYVYLSRAFHPSLGFLSGWVSLWVGFSAPIAAAATACAHYASVALPIGSLRIAAAALIVVISLLHAASVAWGARAQTLLTVVKAALLVAFVAAALLFGQGSFTHFAGGGAVRPGALASALVYVAFAYSGWNAAAYIAGEVASPGRTLPRALLFGTLTVTLLYLALNAAFVYALPLAELGERPELVAERAASALFGASIGRIVAGGIAALLLSSVSAMVMAGPRVYMAMAEDGLFFRALSRRGPGGAPQASIALQCLLSVLLALTASFEALITYVGFTLSAFSALTVLGAVRLRLREPALARPYRAFAWPFSALAYVSLSTVVVIFSIAERPAVALAGVATLLSGLVAYLTWRGLGRHASEAHRIAHDSASNHSAESGSERIAARVTQDRRTCSARRRRRRWQPGMPRPPYGPHPRA